MATAMEVRGDQVGLYQSHSATRLNLQAELGFQAGIRRKTLGNWYSVWQNG